MTAKVHIRICSIICGPRACIIYTLYPVWGISDTHPVITAAKGNIAYSLLLFPACGCSNGSVSEECDQVTGVCQCLDGAIGDKCNGCGPEYEGEHGLEMLKCLLGINLGNVRSFCVI